jgi:hypothetical protein
VISRFYTLFRISLGLLCWQLLAANVFAAEGEDIDFVLPDDLDSLLVEPAGPHFDMGGWIRNETAYRFDEPRSFTKIRNTVSLNGTLEFGKHAKLYGSGWAYHDLVYELFNYETIVARTVREEKEPLVFVEQLENEKDTDVIDLREFYLDLYLNNLDVRIGRQFIIWGVLEGIRIVDEINPMDFRELILPSLLEYRIPLWSAKANYYRGDANLELIWIPDLTFHKAAPSGSEWELFQVLDKTTTPTYKNPAFHEYGVKLTKPILDTEISLSYFYTWDDYPTTFRVISQSELQSPDPTTELAILPTYMRMHVFGSTFVREIKGNILKGEFAYVKGKYFAIVDQDVDQDGYLDHDGELMRDHIRWGIGYDFSLFGADFSPAIAQWMILDYTPEILTDQYDTTLNIFIRKPLQKISAVFTLLGIHLLNFEETYVKPKFTFNVTNRFQVMAGLDYFIGRRTQFGRASNPNDPGGLIDVEQRAQFLGNFKTNRRVFVDFKYNF